MPTNPNKLLQTTAQDFTRYIRDAVIISDGDFKIVHWNEAAEKLYGWTTEEALGQIGTQLLKTEFPNSHKEIILAAIQKNGYYRGEGIQSCKNGCRIHVEVDSIVLKSDDGEITGYLSFNRDITEKKLVQDALERHQSFLEALTNNLPGLVGYWDAKLHCGFANKAYQEWFGRKPKDMLGIHIRELLGEAIYSQNLPYIEGALAGKTQTFHRTLKTPEGISRDSYAQYVPHFQNEMVIGFFVLVSDVTSLKNTERRLQTALDFQNAISDSSAFAIIQGDIDGTIQFINPAAEKMLGYTRDELVGKHSPALFHDLAEVAKRAEEFSQELGQSVAVGFETFVIKSQLGLPNEHEWTYVHKSGRRFPVLLGVTAIRNQQGEITGYLGTAADISKNKQQENQLREAIAVAEKANQTKGDFLATMSHEIRTPMNGVIGMIHAMAESSLNEDQRDLLLTMQQSGELLLSVINDILDYSKIEAGHMEVNHDPVPLAEVISEMIVLMKGLVEKKGLRMRFDNPITHNSLVLGDRERIKQVMLNLIGNAIKFTDQGSITIQVQEIGDKMRIHVFDTGIGIAQEKQARLFERFTQADASSTRRHGGTGLGLAISKRLIELMNGTMGFTSQENEGSTFWMELPRCIADSIPKQSLPEKSHTMAPEGIENLAASESLQAMTTTPSSWSPVPNLSVHILLAEDNNVNQKVALRLLQKMQCTVEVARDGAEAFQFATSQSFDLILMDCQMPNMDGFEATRKIRDWESNHPEVNGQGKISFPRTPIVALTAGAMTDEKAKCFACGMDAFMAKPFKPQEMQKLIFETRERRRTRGSIPQNQRIEGN